MRPLIIGIDPGTTSAFAALDFNFSLLLTVSKRDFSMSEMISSIICLGDPLIIGTDKKEIPSFIKSISQKFGAKVITPRYDLKKGEKKRIVHNYHFSRFTKNAHETDALASAIYAFNEYKPLIKKIRTHLEKEEKINLLDDIFELVILEEVSIHKAISLMESNGQEIIKKIKKKRTRQLTPPKELSPEQKQIMFLKSQNIRYRQEIGRLGSELALHKEKKVDLDREAKKMLSFKEKRILYFEKQIKLLNKENKSLKEEIDGLTGFISVMNGSVLIKKLKSLSREEYFSKKDKLGIKQGEIIFAEDIRNPSNKVLLDLIENKNTIIICENKNNSLGNGFKLIERSRLNLLETCDFALADKSELEQRIREGKAREDILKDIVEEYRKKRQVNSDPQTRTGGIYT